jgi:putative oxidoreductase
MHMLTWLKNSNTSQAPVDFAILILRVFSGGFIMTHGIPKVHKIFSGDLGFGDPIGLGPEVSLVLVAFAEAICGLLVILGLGTRWATIPLIIAMAVAGFIAHAADPFGTKEKPLLFLVIFIVLLFTGGGKYSLDNKVFGS